MPKTTALDQAKAEKREQALQALKDRGPASNETSIPKLRARVALIERILGIAE